MRNIRLTIEYDGTDYAGWQSQKRRGSKTIQEEIEKAIEKITREKVKLIGSGRTDAGVHALAQVANFKTDSGIAAEKLQKALNAVLPEDIAITKVEAAGLDFHSRFLAKSKAYRYTILNRSCRSALFKEKAYFLPYPLNLRLMQKEAKSLLGRHDFRSFQAKGKKERGAIRTVKSLKIRRDGDFIHIEIEADGFLYNMVRNIVGTLIEVGRGKMPEGSTGRILRAKDRKVAGPAVPARGLCLLKVRY